MLLLVDPFPSLVLFSENFHNVLIINQCVMAVAPLLPQSLIEIIVEHTALSVHHRAYPHLHRMPLVLASCASPLQC